MHLLQNALIADVAPLLVLLGLTPRMREKIGRLGPDRLRARWILPIWLGAWYLTHLAPFYDWALRTGWGLNIEHAILIAAGLLFWWPIVSGRLSPPAALGYLAVAFVGSSFLGLAYIFSSRPFYSFYEHAPRLWGLSRGARPEPRRDPHERRADARLPPRDRLVRHAAARRGACARGGRRSPAEAAFGYIGIRAGSATRGLRIGTHTSRPGLVRRERARRRVVVRGEQGREVRLRERVRRPVGRVRPARNQRHSPGAGAEQPLPRGGEPGGVPRPLRGVRTARRGRGATPAAVGLLQRSSLDRRTPSWAQARGRV